MGAKEIKKRCPGSFMSIVPVSPAVMFDPKSTSRGRAMVDAGTPLVSKSAARHVVLTYCSVTVHRATCCRALCRWMSRCLTLLSWESLLQRQMNARTVAHGAVGAKTGTSGPAELVSPLAQCRAMRL